MEVRPGYKKTEVGVIPEEWEVKPLREAVEFLDGRRRPVKDSDRAKMRGDIPYYGASGIVDYVNAHLFDEDLILLGEDGENILSRNCRLAFKISGKTWVNNHAHVLKPKPSMALDYLVEFLESKDYAQYNTGTAQPKLNKAVCSGLLVLCPPLPEQRAIATALRDVDALLGALDQLIAKKRDVKQAAMQQLLTGQTRLPGFHGEWEVSTFAKVVRHHAGNSTLIKGKSAQSPASGLFPGFSASGQDVWCDRYEYEGDAIIVSAVGSRCGKAFAATGKWCAIANTHVVWPNENKVDRRFLGLYINDEDFWLKSGSGQPFVLFKQTFARPLRLPSKAEQTAIAAVLTDIDAELAALERRLAKTRALKQGMMQELLTGRIRLI